MSSQLGGGIWEQCYRRSKRRTSFHLNQNHTMESGDFSKTDPISEEAMSGVLISVIEINSDGWVSRLKLRVDELLGYFAQIESGETRVNVACFRDLVRTLRIT